MGLFDTVKNKKQDNQFSISTIGRNRDMRVPGTTSPVFVTSESAVYGGHPNPAAVSFGKKPLFVVYNIVSGGKDYDLNECHKILLAILKTTLALTPEGFCDELEERGYQAYHHRKAQLFYGFRKVDFILFFGKN